MINDTRSQYGINKELSTVDDDGSLIEAANEDYFSDEDFPIHDSSNDSDSDLKLSKIRSRFSKHVISSDSSSSETEEIESD
eukprot:Seg5489.4 transcript_id=Seg5489.4/GoldUCD/mRNA.D3Y31 product="hypothetical protein" protein_id=Seg5489.4/GoldUCD/D3Y31